MIRFVSGKPGGGKSLYAVLSLVEELRATHRFIVTNLALELRPWVDGGGKARKGLLALLQDKYGSTFEAERRILFLADEAVPRFFAVRPLWNADTQSVDVNVLPKEEDGRFRLSAGRGGVAYFIDEAHEFFAARDWQKTGKETLSWASQQRRAGDDAWMVTQVVNNVEKQLRGVSQECVHLVNHRLLRIAMFRQPDALSYRVYGSTPPAPNEHWLAAGKLQCDREWIYGCYNTARGVGVAGNKADIGVRAKGLHWMNLFWMFLVLGVVCYIANKAVQAGVGKATRLAGPVHSAVSNVTVVPRPAIVPPSTVPRSREVAPDLPRDVKPDYRPWVVASFLKGSTSQAFRSGSLLMSDGRMVPGTNIAEVFNGWVVDGRFLSSVATAGTNVTLSKGPASVKGR